MSSLIEEIPKYAKGVVLLKETGTETIKEKIMALKNLQTFEEENLKNSIPRAFSIAQKGDIILFSPAFASFGTWFKNEYDRGEQFNRLLSVLK